MICGAGGRARPAARVEPRIVRGALCVLRSKE